jgi:hypothetical protein
MAKFDPEYQDLILKTCDMLNLNGGTNIAKVAREFCIDYYALRRRFYGIGSSKSKPGSPQRLNSAQDYALFSTLGEKAG